MYVLLALGGGALASVLSYLLGRAHGAKAKLNELHDLQDEGWLTITYNGQGDEAPDVSMPNTLPASGRGYPTSARDVRDTRMEELVYGDREVSRTRRDSEDRRIDWATTLRHMQEDDVHGTDDLGDKDLHDDALHDDDVHVGKDS